MYSLDAPLRGKHKIGISGNVDARRAEIENQLRYSSGKPVKVRVAVAVPILWAKRWESYLHNKLAALNVDVPYHAGHTEWFKTQNPVAAILYLLIIWKFGFGLTLGRVAITAVLYWLPFPLDSVIKLTMLFLIQLLIPAGLAYLML
jgi:hypothetical protein